MEVAPSYANGVTYYGTITSDDRTKNVSPPSVHAKRPSRLHLAKPPGGDKGCLRWWRMSALDVLLA